MLRVKLHVKDGCILQDLIKAFFSENEFNSSNSIFIKNDIVELKIFFEEKPPKNLINVISACKVEEFVFDGAGDEKTISIDTINYELVDLPHDSKLYIANTESTATSQRMQDNNSEVISESAQKENVTNSNDLVQNDSEITNSAEVQNPEDLLKEPEKVQNPVKRKISVKNNVEFSELDQIFENSSTKPEFLKNVEEWLNLDKEEPLFILILEKTQKTIESGEKITGKLLDEITNANGFKTYILAKLRNKIKSKTGGRMPNFFNKFLELYIKCADENNNSEKNETKDDEDAGESECCSSFDCFPYMEEFEEFLSELDYTDSIDNIVNSIMTEIGSDYNCSRAIEVKMLNLAICAAKLESFPNEIDEICNSAGIQPKSKLGMETRIELGKMASNYVAESFEGRANAIIAYSFLRSINSFIQSKIK